MYKFTPFLELKYKSMFENNNLPVKSTPASLERVAKLIEIGNKLTKSTNTFTDPRDGKIYKIVKIGTQTWFAENLAYKADKGCWAYDNDESNVATYGYLYDWETAKKVCPKGWHLPTKEEWQTLIDFLGGKDVAGEKLKSTSGWERPNTGATNISGFTALPGGYQDYGWDYDDGYGPFFNMGSGGGCWWSTSEFNARDAWNFCLVYDMWGNGPNVHINDVGKQTCFSVRCLKDY